MYNKLKSVLSTLLGFVIIITAGWLAIQIVIQFANWFNGLSEPLQTGIMAAAPIVGVALISLYANKALETKRSVEQAMRPKKLELYTEFNKFFLSIFTPDHVEKTPNEKEITKFFAEKNPELITFASNSVIEKWGKLRIGLSDSRRNDHKMFLVEELLKEIRSDLGHGKRGSRRGDILRIFVNDVDDYLKK